MNRPSEDFGVEVVQEGDRFMALLGQNIQEGIVGFGDTPEEALADFDRAYEEETKH